MLAPLLAAAVLLASADAATLPVARTIGNTCAAIDTGLVLSSHLLWPFPTNFGRLNVCVCTNTLDQYLQINSVTRVAVDVVGLATVRSYIAAAIRTSSRRPGSCFVPQGLSCVPCSLQIGEGDNLVVAAGATLTTGLNLGKGDALKANTSLSSTGNLRVGTDANTSLNLATDVKLAANSTTNTSLNTSGNLVVDSKTNADLTNLDTDLKAAVNIGANLNTNTDVHSGSGVVVGSKADLDLSATAKLGSNVHLGVDASASLAATASLDSVKVAVAANAVATGVAAVTV